MRFSTLNDGMRSSISEPLGGRAWLAIAGAVIVGLWGLGSSDQPSRSNSNGRSYTAPYQTYEVTSPSNEVAESFYADPVPAFTGEVRFSGAGQRLAPLEIVTRAGSDYFVKVVNANTGVTEVYLFVRGGERLEVQMPLGTYELRYASGDVWYGEELLFGPATNYSRADAPFQFRDAGDQYEGYTVELYMQAGGNLNVDEIPASQF